MMMTGSEAETIVGSRHIVRFRSGEVLSAAMLENTIGEYGDQTAFLRSMYAGYGHGILRGMELSQDGAGDLWLSPGIVRARDGSFFFCGEKNLTKFFGTRSSAEWSQRSGNLLVLQKGPVSDPPHAGVRHQALRLEIHNGEAQPEPREDELLLFTFSGAKVHAGRLTVPRTLRDFEVANEADVNVLRQPYACLGGKTFPPMFFRALREAINQKAQRDTLDQSLLLILDALPVLPLTALATYCKEKNVGLSSKATRNDLLAALLDAIDVTIAPSASASSTTEAPVETEEASDDFGWFQTSDADQAFR